MSCNTSNALSRNKNVFSLRLNVFSEISVAQSSVGRLFHAQGPCMVKLQLPQLVRVRGTVRRPEGADQRWRLMTDGSGWQYS